MVSWMHYEATDLSVLFFSRYFFSRMWFKSIFVRLFSMTDSCLLICVHECSQYRHYLHMIIVTINHALFFRFNFMSVAFLNSFNNSSINTQSKCLLNSFQAILQDGAEILVESKDIDDDRAFAFEMYSILMWNTFLNTKLPAIPLHFIVVTKSTVISRRYIFSYFN